MPIKKVFPIVLMMALSISPNIAKSATLSNSPLSPVVVAATIPSTNDHTVQGNIPAEQTAKSEMTQQFLPTLAPQQPVNCSAADTYYCKMIRSCNGQATVYCFVVPALFYLQSEGGGSHSPKAIVLNDLSEARLWRILYVDNNDVQAVDNDQIITALATIYGFIDNENGGQDPQEFYVIAENVTGEQQRLILYSTVSTIPLPPMRMGTTRLPFEPYDTVLRQPLTLYQNLLHGATGLKPHSLSLLPYQVRVIGVNVAVPGMAITPSGTDDMTGSYFPAVLLTSEAIEHDLLDLRDVIQFNIVGTK
jgi:hypothetical protein